ncbi:MAG TPA: beta-N-acetylhexosaminidase [Nitrospinota bacterium]|nr:beta-N-acetylhexosaminidase [Nitrospinota bacterium]
MNLEEKIGQLFIVGFEGTELSESIVGLIKQEKIGGVILFSRNFKDIPQLIKLINDLQTCSLEYQDLPLFVSVDQEGGRVSRFGPPFTQFPPCSSLGSFNDENDTKLYAKSLANELKLCGINMNYAPVLDILTNKENKVIGDRSFGSDPELVACHGNIVIKEFLDHNLIPVGKHFPGHGATSLDSHFDLPEVDTDIEHLKTVETMPFQKAIQNGLEVIMTAHVKYHRIDPLFPATLSKTILTEFLKGELGYKGLIITDDLEMKAVEGHYSEEEIPVLAVLAGADCLLVCHNHDRQQVFINGLKTALKKGDIHEKKIQESFGKIIDLKNRFIMPYQKANGQEALKIFKR